MGLRLLVGDWFQVLFHSPPGVLFTFPSRYWFAIGGQEYLALEGGPPGFPQGFSCPGVLGWLFLRQSVFRYRAFTVSGAGFHQASRNDPAFLLKGGAAAPPQSSHDPSRATPAGLARVRFGLFRVRSPLLAESRLISLPRGTKMFQVPRFPSRLRGMLPHHGQRVAAFGHPGITACSPLPQAFRCAPRPSSAPGPKASTRRPL